jgi:hypothetical protein
MKSASQANEIGPTASEYDSSVTAGGGNAYRFYVLWLLFFVYVIHHPDRNILLLLQEPIRKEFALSDSLLARAAALRSASPTA